MTVSERLLALLIDRGQLSVSDAAQILDVPASSLSRTALRMTSRGLLQRRESPFDRRRTELVVTAKGKIAGHGPQA